MAAGESVVEASPGEEDPSDDDDWSDFTSDNSIATFSTCFEEKVTLKTFPSNDASWIFQNISETTRRCFPIIEPQGFEEIKEKPLILEGNLKYSNYFPQPVWKGSQFEAALINSLALHTAAKEKEKELDVEVKREPGIFDFHHLAERNMDYWLGKKTQLGVAEPPQTGLSRSRESLGNDSTKLSEFNGDVEIWTDSDGAESDEFFVLAGEQRAEETRSFEESHAAAGLHQLPMDEVQELRDEMAIYVKEYSDSLVEELMVKDEQLREKEVKNVFISSLLALQSKLRDFQSTPGKKRNGPSINKYLTTVIPYTECPGGPDKPCLEKLVEIMDAIRSESPMVPSLLTEYILKVLCPE